MSVLVIRVRTHAHFIYEEAAEEVGLGVISQLVDDVVHGVGEGWNDAVAHRIGLDRRRESKNRIRKK